MNLSEYENSVEFTEKYPLATFTYPNWEVINPELEKAIRAVGDQQNRQSNVKAQMTGWTMWNDDQPGAEYFKEICTFACKVSATCSPVEDWRPTVTNCWGVIYRQGEYTVQHNHWPAVWSFTYYVKVESESAPIVFPTAKKAVHPRDGLFCLFPGWVDHYVPPLESDTERIMVAGNIAQLT